jgi:Spy/CpxP family protein refolding chaperone
MKNKQLNIVLLVLAVIMSVSINSWAQRGHRMGRGNSCCLNITGLTEKQKTEIADLKQQHRKEMDAFRAEWRQSAAYAAREVHQAEVSKKVTAHRDAVRKLLNEDQQRVFDNPRSSGGRNFGKANGRGMGRGVLCRGNGVQRGRYGHGWKDSNNL